MTSLYDLRHGLRSLQRKMALIIGRGRVGFTNEATGLRRVQIELLPGEVRNEVEHVEPFGLTAAPMPGAEHVTAAVGGGRDHPVVIVIADRRYRPRGLANGEVCLYDANGHRILLTKTGIVVEAAGNPLTIRGASKVRMETPRLEVTGQIVDLCDMQAASIADLRVAYDRHHHADPQGGETDEPTEQV